MLGYLLRFLAVVLLIRFVMRVIALWLRPRAGAAEPPTSTPMQDLVRDRVCNTFVARERAIVALVNGHEEYFCSTACRDKALLGPASAAS